jgi:MFS family permease
MDEAVKYRTLPWSLAHVALNAFFFTWTFGGSIFILFLDDLGLPKDQIGLMLSFFPFAGLLALGTGAWIARFGRKRMYMLGYGIRKPIMATLLFLPWMLAHLGYPVAVAYVYVVVLSVATLRALAETAYFPWLQEFVPNAVRGKYSALNTILVTLTSLVALWIGSQVIGRGTGIQRYMLLISLGSAIGLFAVSLMAFVPGGKPIYSDTPTRPPIAHLGQTLRDRNFVYFLAGLGCYSAGAYMLSSFLPLFLKDALGLAPGMVVSLDMMVNIGSVAGSLLAGVLADRLGSRPVMMPGLVLSVIIPAGWLCLGAEMPHIVWLCGALYFGYGAFSSIASIGAIRLLFNSVIPVEKNTEYTAFYYAWAGFTGGLMPLMAGKLLHALGDWHVNLGAWGMGAFQLLFLLSLVGFSASTYFYGQVKPDSAYSIRTAARAAVRNFFSGGRA